MRSAGVPGNCTRRDTPARGPSAPGRAVQIDMARFEAFSSRDFRLLFLGQAVSLTGTQMQQVAVIWQLYRLTNSPLSLGLIGLCKVVPIVLFAVGGGVVADALDRRRLMLATQCSLALSSVTLAVLSATGRASPLAIYAVIFCSGTALAFDGPARQSLVPLLVPREHLPNALSAMATAWQLATIIGPPLAGPILARWGELPVYLIDIGSFAAVIGSLLALQHRGGPARPSAINLAAAAEGFRFLRQNPLILSMMLLDFFATFFGGSMLLMPIFAEQLLGTGAEGLGLLYAAQPVGAAVTASLMSVLPAPRRQGRVLLAAVVVYGLAIAGFGASRWLWLSLLLLAISGAADTVSMVIRQTIRQLLTPDELRGRMTSVNMMFFMGGPQLGEFEAGLLASATSAPFSVTSGGLLCVVAVVVTAVVVPSLRRYEHRA